MYAPLNIEYFTANLLWKVNICILVTNMKRNELPKIAMASVYLGVEIKSDQFITTTSMLSSVNISDCDNKYISGKKHY